jgi:chromosome segregation ATPase
MIDPEFSAVLSLITLVTDPAAAKARLQELQSAREALEAQEAETNSAAAALQTERSELTAQAAALREREVKVHGEELKIAADRTELELWKRDQRASRLITVGAGGLTREPDDTPVDPDPITDRYAESMTPPAAVRAAPRHKSRARG